MDNFKAGEIEKERALFEEIKARGLTPDVRSYSILIQKQDFQKKHTSYFMI